MYKIYINGNTLTIADSQLVRDRKTSKKVLIAPYTGKTKMLLSYIDMLEKTDRFDEVLIHSSTPKLLVKDLESLYKVVKASGGVVNDGDDNILFIFRRGHWDLPKGKIEVGESKKVAAIREVAEETGIGHIKLHSRVITTRHAFKHKGKRALKKTYWYKMEAPNQELIPQAEEEITEARWVKLSEVEQLSGPMFKNIMDVITRYREKRILA